MIDFRQKVCRLHRFMHPNHIILPSNADLSIHHGQLTDEMIETDVDSLVEIPVVLQDLPFPGCSNFFYFESDFEFNLLFM